jgi:hypothetical protein
MAHTDLLLEFAAVSDDDSNDFFDIESTYPEFPLGGGEFVPASSVPMNISIPGVLELQKPNKLKRKHSLLQQDRTSDKQTTVRQEKTLKRSIRQRWGRIDRVQKRHRKEASYWGKRVPEAVLSVRNLPLFGWVFDKEDGNLEIVWRGAKFYPAVMNLRELGSSFLAKCDGLKYEFVINNKLFLSPSNKLGAFVSKFRATIYREQRIWVQRDDGRTNKKAGVTGQVGNFMPAFSHLIFPAARYMVALTCYYVRKAFSESTCTLMRDQLCDGYDDSDMANLTVDDILKGLDHFVRKAQDVAFADPRVIQVVIDSTFPGFTDDHEAFKEFISDEGPRLVKNCIIDKAEFWAARIVPGLKKIVGSKMR